MQEDNNKSQDGRFRIVIGLIIAIVLVVGYWYFQQWYAPTLRIEPSAGHLMQGKSVQLVALFDPDGPKGKASEEDVTFDTVWTTDNKDIGYIGNVGPSKGLLILPGNGEIKIQAKYKTFSTEILGTIQTSSMEISCYPVGKTAVKVGRGADYTVFFNRIGLPDYKYVWTAPEEQSSTSAIPYFGFLTPGEKIVHVDVTDRAGTHISVDCNPLTVTK